MTLSSSEAFLLFIGIISLPLFVFPLLKHIRNQVFVRRINVLEDLLNSKLRCFFSIISQPTVEIDGKYKGRSIKFSSYLAGRTGLARIGEFILTSSKLPLQYSMVSENVHQVGNTLIYSNCDDFVMKRTVLGKARAIQILDELINTVEKCESAENQEQC